MFFVRIEGSADILGHRNDEAHTHVAQLTLVWYQCVCIGAQRALIECNRTPSLVMSTGSPVAA